MPNIYETTPHELSRWLESDQAVLVDVREPNEYDVESIVGARNLPLSTITLDEAHLPEHRHKKLVLQCKSGRRSMMACEKLMQEGVAYDIWNLQGGIMGWRDAGLPVLVHQPPAGNGMPIERQVQLIISLMVLIGLVIAEWIHPFGIVFTILAGFGLLNAGLTGWCGMRILVSKFPWNKG